MDTKDIYFEIKERMRSPLFGSFVIIWLLWNWEIPVGLIVLDQNQLKSLGFQNYIDFIKGNVSKSDSWVPLFFAVIYSISSPLINSGLKFLRYWAISKYNQWELKYASNKNLYVPISWFMRLNQRYLSKSEEVNDTIRTLEQEQKEIKDLRKELDETKLKAQKQFESLQSERDQRDISIIRGLWNAKTESHEISAFRFDIHEVVQFDKQGNQIQNMGSIRHFENLSNHINFMVLSVFQKAKIRHFRLEINPEKTKMTGHIYEDGKVPEKIEFNKREIPEDFGDDILK